jgi:hypothetical protein
MVVGSKYLDGQVGLDKKLFTDLFPGPNTRELYLQAINEG